MLVSSKYIKQNLRKSFSTYKHSTILFCPVQPTYSNINCSKLAYWNASVATHECHPPSEHCQHLIAPIMELLSCHLFAILPEIRCHRHHNLFLSSFLVESLYRRRCCCCCWYYIVTIVHSTDIIVWGRWYGVALKLNWIKYLWERYRGIRNMNTKSRDIQQWHFVWMCIAVV